MMKNKNDGKVMPNVDMEIEGGKKVVKYSDPRSGKLLERLVSLPTDGLVYRVNFSIRIGLHQLQHAKVMSTGTFPELDEDIAGYHWILQQDLKVKEEFINLQKTNRAVRHRVEILKARM